jgi:hypothetical protein
MRSSSRTGEGLTSHGAPRLGRRWFLARKEARANEQCRMRTDVRRDSRCGKHRGDRGKHFQRHHSSAPLRWTDAVGARSESRAMSPSVLPVDAPAGPRRVRRPLALRERRGATKKGVWKARRDVLTTRERKRQGHAVHVALRWSLNMRIRFPKPGPPPIIASAVATRARRAL